MEWKSTPLEELNVEQIKGALDELGIQHKGVKLKADFLTKLQEGLAVSNSNSATSSEPPKQSQPATKSKTKSKASGSSKTSASSENVKRAKSSASKDMGPSKVREPHAKRIKSANKTDIDDDERSAEFKSTKKTSDQNIANHMSDSKRQNDDESHEMQVEEDVPVKSAKRKGSTRKVGSENAGAEKKSKPKKTILPPQPIVGGIYATAASLTVQQHETILPSAMVAVEMPNSVVIKAESIKEPVELKKLTVGALRNLLDDLGLPVTGTKPVLIARIEQHRASITLLSEQGAQSDLLKASQVEAAQSRDQAEEDDEQVTKDDDEVEDISVMTYQELRQALRDVGLKSSGKKEELMGRLREARSKVILPKTPKVIRKSPLGPEAVVLKSPPVSSLLSGVSSEAVKVDAHEEEEKRSARMKRSRTVRMKLDRESAPDVKPPGKRMRQVVKEVTTTTTVEEDEEEAPTKKPQRHRRALTMKETDEELSSKEVTLKADMPMKQDETVAERLMPLVGASIAAVPTALAETKKNESAVAETKKDSFAVTEKKENVAVVLPKDRVTVVETVDTVVAETTKETTVIETKHGEVKEESSVLPVRVEATTTVVMTSSGSVMNQVNRDNSSLMEVEELGTAEETFSAPNEASDAMSIEGESSRPQFGTTAALNKVTTTHKPDNQVSSQAAQVSTHIPAVSSEKFSSQANIVSVPSVNDELSKQVIPMTSDKDVNSDADKKATVKTLLDDVVASIELAAKGDVNQEVSQPTTSNSTTINSSTRQPPSLKLVSDEAIKAPTTGPRSMEETLSPTSAVTPATASSAIASVALVVTSAIVTGGEPVKGNSVPTPSDNSRHTPKDASFQTAQRTIHPDSSSRGEEALSRVTRSLNESFVSERSFATADEGSLGSPVSQITPDPNRPNDDELLDQLESALNDATRAGITQAEFDLLDAVLQSFVVPQSSEPTLRRLASPLDDSFMQYTQPTPVRGSSSLSYAPTPIQRPSSALHAARRPPVPLFSPNPVVSKQPPQKKSIMAERILSALKEDQVPSAKFVFTPVPHVFEVPPLVRSDLLSRSSNTVEFQFDK